MKTLLKGLMVLSLVACNRLADLQNAITGIIVNPSDVYVGELATITVADSDSYRMFKWSMLDEEGFQASGCDNLFAPIVQCRFETTGQLEISLEATDRNGEVKTFSRNIDVLDPASKRDQSPKIVLKIRNKDTQELIATVATIRFLESGEAAFEKETDIEFDLTATTDDNDGIAGMKLELNTGSGFSVVEAVSTRRFTNVAALPSAIRVTDSNGHVTEKSFTLFIQCKDGDQAPMAIDTNAIVISAGSFPNFFDYDASSAVTGGIGEYRVKYDFNGDDMYDIDWKANESINAYTVFGGDRQVGIKVWETGCNYFAKATFTHNFVMQRADGIPGTPQGPQVGNYFIQADITGLEGNDAKAANATYIATKATGSLGTPKVQCDYHKDGMPTGLGYSMATLSIYGLNVYDEKTGEKNPHGMSMTVSGINDNWGVVENPVIDTSVSFISKAIYFTDGGSDSIADKAYVATQPCVLTLIVTVPGPQGGTCFENPNMGYEVIMDGTYSCPEMTAGDGTKISATTGAFYCEKAKVEACLAGPGGGSGGIPPTPR